MSTDLKASFAVGTITAGADISTYSPGVGDVGATFSNLGNAGRFLGGTGNTGIQVADSLPASACQASGPASSDDMTYSLVLDRASTTALGWVGIAFDVVDALNYWCVFFQELDTSLYISRVVAGSQSFPAQAVVAITSARWKLVVRLHGGGSPTISVAWGLESGSQSPVTGLQDFAATGLVVSGTKAGLHCYSPGGINTTLFALQGDTVDLASPTSITLSGANTGTVGSASASITATLDHPAPSGGTTIALSVATITGTFTTTPPTIAAGDLSGTFTFTASSAGTGLITASSSGLTSGTRSFTSSDPLPTSITLSGASSGTVGSASASVTITLDHPAPSGGTSVALSVATITGSFTSTPTVIASGQTTGTFTFTASSAGTGLITAASSGLTSGTRSFTAAAASSGGAGPIMGIQWGSDLDQLVAANIPIRMVSSTDHASPATGVTLTVRASKDGGAFATITPTITERTVGFYSVAATSAHLDTAGFVVFEASGSGADTAYFGFKVVPYFDGLCRAGSTTGTIALQAGTGDVSGRTVILGSGTLSGQASVIASVTGAGGSTPVGILDTSVPWVGGSPAVGDKYLLGVPTVGAIMIAAQLASSITTLNPTQLIRTDGGTVGANPTATGFTSNSGTLTSTQSGAYKGSIVIFQATSSLGRAHRIVSAHTLAAGVHSFTLTSTDGTTPAVGPVAGDTFRLG